MHGLRCPHISPTSAGCDDLQGHSGSEELKGPWAGQQVGPEAGSAVRGGDGVPPRGQLGAPSLGRGPAQGPGNAVTNDKWELSGKKGWA